MAQRAINAVLAGTSACLRARNNYWLRTMLSAEIFQRSEFLPKDYWPFPVDLTPLVYECRTCCGSLNKTLINDKNKEPVPPKPQQDYSKYVYSTQRQEERKLKEFKLKDL